MLFAKSKLLRAQERTARKRNVDNSGYSASAGQRKSKWVSLPDELKYGDLCIFCKKSDGVLHNCATLGLDKTLREQAEALQDTDLLATIADEDLIGIEAKYHKNYVWMHSAIGTEVTNDPWLHYHIQLINH